MNRRPWGLNYRNGLLAVLLALLIGGTLYRLEARAVAAAPTGAPPVACDFTVVAAPPPQGTNEVLWGVAAVSATDAWAVGQTSSPTMALIIHWDGTSWQRVPTAALGQAGSLNGITAVSAQDIWAVGATHQGNRNVPLIAHWDGQTWAVVPSPAPGSAGNTLEGVIARTSTDIWAAGEMSNGGIGGPFQTLVEHWDGQTWTVSPSLNPFSNENGFSEVAPVAANDVWAVGQGNDGGSSHSQILIEHWNGLAWQVVPAPATGYGAAGLFSVAALAANDLWAVGYTERGGLTAHWDGTQWTAVPNPISTQMLSSWQRVAGTSSTDVWTVGVIDGNGQVTAAAHWDGSTWTLVPSANPASYSNVLAGASAVGSGAWAVGYQFDGSREDMLIERTAPPCFPTTPTPPPGPNPTATPTLAPAPSPTATPTLAPAPSPTATPTLAPAPSPTATPTLAPAPSPTATPTLAPAPSATVIASPTPCAVGQFSDVYPTDYFATPVQYLVSHAAISGYADCTFRPYNDTTRAQMVKIVVLGFNKPITTPATGGYTFADVPPANPFFALIETAAAGNIISGYGCGSPGEPCDGQNRPYFRPYTSVTRGQLAKITVVAGGWALLTPATPSFTDVPPGSAFYPFVETAVCHGVISGYADHTFRAATTATRGQIAKIVYLAVTGSGCAGPN